MTPLFVVLALVVVGAVAVVAGGRGGGLGSAGSDRPGPWLPVDREVTQADLKAVHFGVGFRGYRMDEVDLVLDRLGAELRERDARIAALQASPPDATSAPASRPPAAGSGEDWSAPDA